jgi:hypothetical protein
MQDPQRTASTWRIGFDLAAFIVLAVIAGMVAAMTLAGIALLLTGAGSMAPGATPDTPVQAPASRTMVANGAARAH